MASSLEIIDDLNFEQVVLGSEQPYLLDFGATYCSPCKALEPLLEELAAEYRGSLKVGKLDIDLAPAVAQRFGIRAAPTLVLFVGGRERARRLGLTSKRNLLQWLESGELARSA